VRQLFHTVNISIIISLAFFVTQAQSQPSHKGSIGGVYRFVSETTTLKGRDAKTISLKPPEWSGMFLFVDGHFSISLEDQKRKDVWIGDFPKDLQELGYESFGGAFDLSGSTLTLKINTTLNPFLYQQTRTYTFVISGKKLTLKRILRPYTEDLRDGEEVTVLMRISD